MFSDNHGSGGGGGVYGSLVRFLMYNGDGEGWDAKVGALWKWLGLKDVGWEAAWATSISFMLVIMVSFVGCK